MNITVTGDCRETMRAWAADGYTENRVHLKCFEKIMERGVHEYKTRTKKTPPLPDNAQVSGGGAFPPSA